MARATAREAMKLKRQKMSFPPLDSSRNAKRWFQIMGAALTTGAMKPGQAKELRLLATAFLNSDATGQLADRLDAIEERVEDIGDGKTSEA